MAGLLPTYEEADIVRPGGRPIPEALEPRMGTYYINRGDLRLRVMFASAPVDEPRGSIILTSSLLIRAGKACQIAFLMIR